MDLGAIPLVVLTQDGLDGVLGADWARYQTQLAALSSNSRHVTATGAGHGIQDKSPDLVVAAITAVLDAAADAIALPDCAAFSIAGGACFAL